MRTKSAFSAHSALDSSVASCESYGMQNASRAGAVAVLVAIAACLWAGVFACRDPRSSDGAGGQSGDEGVVPHLQGLGTGGGAAEQPGRR